MTPAKDERVIGRTGVHQVAAISLRGKLRERRDVCMVQLESLETGGQDLERDAVVMLVELREPLCEGHFHS